VRYGYFFIIKKRSIFFTYSWRTRPMALQVFFSKFEEKGCRGCPSVREELIKEENGEEVAGGELAKEELAREEVIGGGAH
jgi:hypothetical protein